MKGRWRTNSGRTSVAVCGVWGSKWRLQAGSCVSADRTQSQRLASPRHRPDGQPDLHRQSLTNAGDANLALDALFLHDRASLKALLDDLGYNG